jgi:hypothetical protein
MSSSTHQEQVEFWRDPTLNNVEMRDRSSAALDYRPMPI